MIARTATILQMEAQECGAAALAMVLAYHGRHEPLAVVRKACGVSRDGTRAAHLLAAARGFGLTARAWRCEPKHLRGLPGPAVVFWSFNHFVVVEGFGRRKAYINDPRTGRQTVTAAEFDEHFTGIALLFEPAPGFERTGREYSVWRGLRQRLRGHGSGVLLVFLAAFVLLLPGIVGATLPKVLIDHVVIGGASAWTRPLLLSMAAAMAALGLLTCFQQEALLRAETSLSMQASCRFFWHVLRLPLDFFAQRFAGEIGFRVGANDRVAALVMGDFATSLVSVLLALACAVLMTQYDRFLAVTTFATAALNIAVLRLLARRRSDAGYRLSHERGNLAGIATSGLLSIESVKAMGGEPEFFARWAGQHARAANAGQDLQSASQALIAAPGLLMALNTAAVLSFGAVRVMDGLLSIGMLITFQALMQTFLQPVNKLMSLGGSLQEIGGDLRRLDDVLDHPTRDDRTPFEEAGPGGRLIGRIELRNVTFGYSRLEPPLIENLSLTVPAGGRIALAGASGSGKSTIAKLVCGLYEPWSGEILLDGRPLAAIPRDVLANSLSLVDQDVLLFEGSVAENIALWDDAMTEETMSRAARDAAIYDEIAAMGGYGAPVEEMGRNLSGGQRQRIEIARALASAPRILVLDEATSALDPVNEKLLADNLRRRGCTCLVVAHRLSAIRDCDEIVVLERGRIMERGSHQDLLLSGGPYARLLDEQ